MTNRSHQNSVALALAVTTPCLAGLWLISVPHSISSSTYTTAMALLISLVGTTITLYRNGQGSGSMGQWRLASEVAPLSTGSRPVNGSATRSGS